MLSQIDPYRDAAAKTWHADIYVTDPEHARRLVTAEERQWMKELDFGYRYGMSAREVLATCA